MKGPLALGPFIPLNFTSVLDLSADFNTSDCNILLVCLENYFGFSGLVLAWLKIYLEEHGVFKTTLLFSDVKFGVPQDSVLGLLFLLFIYYTSWQQYTQFWNTFSAWPLFHCAPFHWNDFPADNLTSKPNIYIFALTFN